jgi:hypothetical protein
MSLIPRLSLCLLLLALVGCNAEEPNLNSGQQNVTDTDDDPSILPIDDDDSADDDCWDDWDDICIDEFDASEACWDALDEDATEEELDACFDVDEALFECFDAEYPDDDDYPEPDFSECEDELDAADACWDTLSEDASDDDFDACMVLEDALWECIGYDDEPVEAYDE